MTKVGQIWLTIYKYLIGWCGYNALSDTPSICKERDKWIRRRLRMVIWKQ
ncbi:group II intron maturase-specific domain-containing protein [Bacillus cytotoxicus]|nr:group II intron maturase-specific domain-containing protein [Bacillus cytotoxicus]MDH2860306.1 hypothetical protein [Bacillus cytotoxicus]MDH2867967.1 hypothetical protein [Bacillus cytotoxicus]MDH2872420.1 hypothetical protein [Bacillus cytotoxicus]MDH2875483.1 hypothetical protein [Bacillus cytotoxicus]MDH2921467.1 hypothetical protein [Bacillus cytotoxicus]